MTSRFTATASAAPTRTARRVRLASRNAPTSAGSTVARRSPPSRMVSTTKAGTVPNSPWVKFSTRVEL